MLIAGVDIGGSHITSAIVNVDLGEILQETLVRQTIDSHAPAAHILEQWASAIKESLAQAGIRDSSVGIAMPGPLDYEQGICLIKGQDKYEDLYGLNIKQMLADALSISPEKITFINDACAFLRGEISGNLQQQYPTILGFTLGTGLGSVSYNDGVIVDADLWRMPFRESIAEEYLATRWFTRRYAELSGCSIPNVRDMLNTPLSPVIFSEFSENLCAVIIEALRRFPSQAIVLGGNIAKASEYFLPATRNLLQEQGYDVPLYIARFGESAALMGAAYAATASRVDK